MKQKSIKIFIVVIFLLLGISKIFAQTKNVWDGTVSNNFAGGSGTQNDPYLISNGAELAKMAHGYPTTTYSGKYFKLTNNIILNDNFSNYKDWADNPPVNNWTPSGRFAGIFDGQGYSIIGIYIDSDKGMQGLFGVLGSNGVIKNLKLVNGYIKSEGVCVSGICAYNDGGSIEYCHNACDIYSSSYSVGGICGENKGKIYHSSNDGIIQAGYRVGGISGKNSSIISNCYNLGNVSSLNGSVGGICGESSFAIQICYNMGSVNGTASGAICGQDNSTNRLLCCGYLSGSALKGASNKDDASLNRVFSYDLESFENGEVAYFLTEEIYERAWGQKLGLDKYPVFSDNKVYKFRGLYSNLKSSTVNNAWKTSGTESSCVTVKNSLDLCNEFTVSAWLYIDKEQIFDKTQILIGAGKISVGLTENNGIIKLNINNQETVSKSVDCLLENKWNYVTLCVSKDSFSTYLNGLLVSSLDRNTYDIFDEFVFGKSVKASFSDIMIWDKALTSEELVESMVGYVVPPENLKFYFNFDDKTGKNYGLGNDDVLAEKTIDVIAEDVTSELPTPIGGAEFYQSGEYFNIPWIKDNGSEMFGYVMNVDNVQRLAYDGITKENVPEDVIAIYYNSTPNNPYYVTSSDVISIPSDGLKLNRSIVVGGLDYTFSIPNPLEWRPISLPENVDLIAGYEGGVSEDNFIGLVPGKSFWYYSFNNDYIEENDKYLNVWNTHIGYDINGLPAGIISFPKSWYNDLNGTEFTFFTNEKKPVVLRVNKGGVSLPESGKLGLVCNPYSYKVTVADLCGSNSGLVYYRYNNITGNFDVVLSEEKLFPFEPILVFNEIGSPIQAPLYIGVKDDGVTGCGVIPSSKVYISVYNSCIEIKTDLETCITVYDIDGKALVSKKCLGVLRLNLPVGFYIIKSENNNQLFSYKVFVK